MGNVSKSINIDSETVALLASIRFSLECLVEPKCWSQISEPVEGERRVLDEESLKATLLQVGMKVLEPLRAELLHSRLIHVVLPASLVKLPIDVLYFGGRPLFLQSPVMYSIDWDVAPTNLIADREWTGLLLSDKSTDPERGVFTVAEDFPHAARIDAAEVDLRILQSRTQVDFTVISAHGRAGYKEPDALQLPNREIVSPELIAHWHPQLVYLDSCNLGISLQYLRGLRSSGVKYMLAPIISNEAGNSSTRTVAGYFAALARGADPAFALYEVKKEIYSAFEQNPLKRLLWRVAPFRIYALN
jgi:hypothetical protein